MLRYLRDLLLPRPADPAGSNLVLITRPEDSVPGELRTARRLMSAGLARLHVRKPGWTAEEHLRFLDGLPDAFWPRVVLYAHPDIVLSRGLAGLHLKAGERVPRAWPEGRPVSTSAHSFDELLEGPRDRSYALLGPVFESVSKRNHAPRRTQREFEVILQRWRSEGGCPVYALGGVTPESAARAREIGFDGVAFIGAVWASDDPVASFLEIERAWLGGEARRKPAKRRD